MVQVLRPRLDKHSPLHVRATVLGGADRAANALAQIGQSRCLGCPSPLHKQSVLPSPTHELSWLVSEALVECADQAMSSIAAHGEGDRSSVSLIPSLEASMHVKLNQREVMNLTYAACPSLTTCKIYRSTADICQHHHLSSQRACDCKVSRD